MVLGDDVPPPARKLPPGLRRWLYRLRLALPQPWTRTLGATELAYEGAHISHITMLMHEEIAIERSLSDGGPIHPYAIWGTERLLEVPWAIRRVPRGPTRVLDIGTAHAITAYHRLLARLDVAELHLADLAEIDLPFGIPHHADARALPFADDSFDAAVCISTLEHIGLDNERYFAEEASHHDEQADDALALRELGRVTHPDGRVLVTVPAGRPADRDWYRQYDGARFAGAVAAAGLTIAEIDFFAHDPDFGWAPSTPEAIATRDYGEGAPCAAALICAALAPPPAAGDQAPSSSR